MECIIAILVLAVIAEAVCIIDLKSRTKATLKYIQDVINGINGVAKRRTDQK